MNDLSFNIDNKYTIDKVLGVGYASKVVLATNEEDKSKVALKIYIPKRDPFFAKKIDEEIDIIKAIEHENVVKLYEHKQGLYNRPNSLNSKKVLYSVFKVYENGDFFDFIKAGGELPVNIARFYFKKLVNVVKHIHHQNYAHRDLKLENIFLDQNFNLILGDFGFSTSLDVKQEQSIIGMHVGTKGYQSPEYIERRGKDLKANDVFALGVILFIMMFGGVPFNEARHTDNRYRFICKENYSEFWNMIKRAAKKETICNDLSILLNGIFSYKNRFTIEDIEASTWYNGEVANEVDVIDEMLKRKDKTIEKKEDYDLAFELYCIPPYERREVLHHQQTNF